MESKNLYMKLNYFVYNNKVYKSGTEFIYNGECEANGEVLSLSNKKCKFLYNQYRYYFESDNTIYCCDMIDFMKNITLINLSQDATKEKQQVYFTDDMIVSTFWYVIIMIVGVIFKDRITLWVFATMIYASYMYRNLKS